jgi:hypothetical protein
VFPNDLTQTPLAIPINLTVLDSPSAVTITGQVRASDSLAPLAAHVGVQGGLGLATDPTGRYSLRLMPGVQTIVAAAPGYLSSTQPLTLTSDQSKDFVLTPDLPRIAARAIIGRAIPSLAAPGALEVAIANAGTQPLHYQAYIPAEPFGIWRSDEPEGPLAGLITLPSDATVLAFGDNDVAQVPLGMAFSLYGKTYTSVYISADGILSFAAPIAGTTPINRCMPNGTLYFSAIAALHADLDPSRGGQVRYALLPANAGFVVSYEDVVQHTGPTAATLTFQVVLRPDGRIELHYGTLAAMFGRAGVGVQRQPGVLTELACGDEITTLAGLTIELRPQPAANIWLQSALRAGTVEPGQESRLELSANWIPPGPWPYRGRVLVLSSDPKRPAIRVTVEVAPPHAPASVWMPSMVTR